MQITYEAKPTDVDDLRDNLMALPTRALREGLLTADTDAEVVVAAPHVQVL